MNHYRANAARAGIVGGALTFEAGGSGAVPAFLITYGATTIGVTARYAAQGAIIGAVSGAAFSGGAAYRFGYCQTEPAY